MIEILDGFPDYAVAVNCTGRITRSDYEQSLIPAVEAALKEHKKVRLLYRAGSEFQGIEPSAVLEDVKVGFSHLSRWERVAVVTDIEWIRLAIRAFSFMIPGTVKFFRLSDESDARRWISEPQ
jgi:hypothetical protein